MRHEIFCDFKRQMDPLIPATRQYLVLNKNILSFQGLCCCSESQSENKRKGKDLARKQEKPHNLRVTIIPKKISALRTISKTLERRFEGIGD